MDRPGMTSPRFWIALLSSDGHLRQRLPAMLEAARPWHVAAFSHLEALVTFLRITPVEMVLLDAERADLPAVEAARLLRHDPRPASPLFRLIALTATDPVVPLRAPPDFDAMLPRQAPPGRLLAGIDLALAPPPRVHFGAPAPAGRAASTPLPQGDKRRQGAEIIPLFGERARRPVP
jgi:CheY-like chemotaxis protein